MKFLRGTNQAAKLRQRTPLRPVTRQATRWSSTFAMDKRLCGALDELKDFESSDGEGAVSWKLFGSPGPIFKFPIFERACVQVQNGETRYMTSDDIAALAPFASQGTSTFQSLTSSNSAKKLSFAEEELKKRRMQDQQQPSWSTTILRPQMWLNAFFTQAGMVLSPLRQAMAPTQLENILFLKMNRRFWNMAMVQTASKQFRYA
ncbi:hypothetical protein PC116_g18129 [Phytophthora cactorum]|uniref:Uncharacterized protein n=1 Tax=Phytophthora cactorum TaxID=29920 RepID=A0A8T1KE84_9STRA|nr:hypothetical protein PC115_g21534 [Phytophthora cactorum]KAG2892596.1 hypothetical protein PC117_g23981 [Phytophthora cactorum]KAG3054958.1 hypothetical protein PC122_g21855 [Phytophthora cactorum]KAG3152525.1 hypothetical protein C6341_g16249 [Phytophthora cactorum]KAG4233668.1 hypothetical protein PC116_g18129 [Phytophthora cactorum]